MISIPFEVELAKEITNGNVDGKVITRDDKSVRILCFDAKQDRPIVALISYDNSELIKSYPKDGIVFESRTSSNDLLLEIPKHLAFNEGDILKFSSNICSWLSIIKDIEFMDDKSYLTDDYVVLMISGEYDCDTLQFDTYSDAGIKVEKPTEEERKLLIEKLKKSTEPQAKEYLNRFFSIEEKQQYEFKPFDKVLVRIDNKDMWCADFFSNLKDGDFPYICVGGIYGQCIPYEGNEHLLGKTESPE